MKFGWIVLAAAGVAVIAADPALARVKHSAKGQCVDRPARPYTFRELIFGRPAPQPNGCAPAVYQYGRYIGQDPDPNIRLQMMRDPETGYAPL